MGESVAVPGRRRNDGRDHFRVAKAGEFLAAFELTARGFDVSIAAEGLPYDLVAQIADRLLRVQVKTAMQPVWDERYVFHTQLGSHKGPKRSRAYHGEDVDLFALVALNLKRIAFITREDVEGRSVLKIDFRRFRNVDVTGETLVNVVEQLLLREFDGPAPTPAASGAALTG
jgi:PD-(D/E)XK endonuclease